MEADEQKIVTTVALHQHVASSSRTMNDLSSLRRSLSNSPQVWRREAERSAVGGSRRRSSRSLRRRWATLRSNTRSAFPHSSTWKSDGGQRRGRGRGWPSCCSPRSFVPPRLSLTRTKPATYGDYLLRRPCRGRQMPLGKVGDAWCVSRFEEEKEGRLLFKEEDGGFGKAERWQVFDLRYNVRTYMYVTIMYVVAGALPFL